MQTLVDVSFIKSEYHWARWCEVDFELLEAAIQNLDFISMNPDKFPNADQAAVEYKANALESFINYAGNKKSDDTSPLDDTVPLELRSDENGETLAA